MKIVRIGLALLSPQALAVMVSAAEDCAGMSYTYLTGIERRKPLVDRTTDYPDAADRLCAYNGHFRTMGRPSVWAWRLHHVHGRMPLDLSLISALSLRWCQTMT